MKAIFLDVDGILAYSDYTNRETNNIDVEKVKMLKTICDETGAKVVIISSWRGSEHYTPRIYYILRSILDEYKIDVIGDAPYIPSQLIHFSDDDGSFNMYTSRDYKILYGTGRGAEVQKWLSKNPVDSFVILDDDDFGWLDYGYEDNWIQPSWYDGALQQHHVDRAIEILNKK